MIDLVGILEAHCTTLGWSFSYGNTANNNLLTSDLVSDKIYLLLETVRRVKTKSEFGGTGEITFNGNFLLLIQSDLDNVYHTQKSVDAANGKYEKNIEPLLQKLELLENLIDCSKYEIVSWEVIDTINSQDFNGDGVIVTYSIKTL